MARPNHNRGAVWSVDEVIELVEIWREEDIEAQLDGMYRNLAVYGRLMRGTPCERSWEISHR
jgi:hypothetical protein